MPNPIFSEPIYKRKKFWIALLVIVMLGLFIIAFSPEITSLLRATKAIALIALGRNVADFSQILNDAWRGVQILAFNGILGFLLLFLVWLAVVAHTAILPVSNLRETHRTAWHLLLYILGLHGQAVFVRNGKVFSSPEELNRPGPGIVVVNFDSAVVLEETLATHNLFTPLFNFIQNLLLIDLDLSDLYASPRARGPGIVFSRINERLRGVVDLRNQLRSQDKVLGYTRDGIELSTRVMTQFTVGQEPDVLHVTYLGDKEPANLRVVQLEQRPDGQIVIGGFSDELDDLDKAEIHQRVSQPQQGMSAVYLPAQATGFRYDQKRVLAAVMSQARDATEGSLKPWQDLPLQVAIGLFREMLSHENYEQLYQARETSGLHLEDFKRIFRLALRNNGLLSFQYIADRLNRDLAPGAYFRRRLMAYNVMELTTPKVLRQRGIKVIFAGFGDLIPVSNAVYQQRLDSWRASWDSSTSVIQAETELEVMRVRNHAHAAAQEELMYSLNRLMQSNNLSRQALALRVLQAVENAAADPRTSQLLPGDTVALLRNVHAWLNDEEAAPPRAIV